MVQTNCRHFNGYKPCGRSEDCSSRCPHRDLIENSILIVHLGALGAVVRSTSLLELIQRKFPHSQITWVTDRPADQILRNHPLIDRVLTTSQEDLLQLAALHFNAAFVIDKSLKAAGVLQSTRAERIFGFRVDSRTGAVMPATSAAVELWSLGLSNQKKFFENKKSEVQLMCEAFELPWKMRMPEYNLPLFSTERQLADKRRTEWRLREDQPIIGINTGCSSVIPAKKLTVKYQREMIHKLLQNGYENLVLLGGPEDSHRNREIGEGLPIFQSPTELGLRDGLVSAAACDLVITGDSLGMHMAISQRKFVIAWFGPTCSHEIELYGRGIALHAHVECAPCWKRSCDKSEMCYDQVSLAEILEAVQKGHQSWQERSEFLLSKPLF
jgi:heptosyltransferase-2